MDKPLCHHLVPVCLVASPWLDQGRPQLPRSWCCRDHICLAVSSFDSTFGVGMECHILVPQHVCSLHCFPLELGHLPLWADGDGSVIIAAKKALRFVVRPTAGPSGPEASGIICRCSLTFLGSLEMPASVPCPSPLRSLLAIPGGLCWPLSPASPPFFSFLFILLHCFILYDSPCPT